MPYSFLFIGSIGVGSAIACGCCILELHAGGNDGKSIRQLSAKDIRFTRNKAGTIVYAIALGWPEEPILIRSLGSAAATRAGTVSQVELLGTQAKPQWRQTAEGLRVDLSKINPTADYATALRVYVTGDG